MEKSKKKFLPPFWKLDGGKTFSIFFKKYAAFFLITGNTIF